MTITRFAFPTDIHFGAGARALVGPHLLEQGCRRPLIVTDRALAKLPADRFASAAEFATALGATASTTTVSGARRATPPSRAALPRCRWRRPG